VQQIPLAGAAVELLVWVAQVPPSSRPVETGDHYG
jgi:hypothetical protein